MTSATAFDIVNEKAMNADLNSGQPPGPTSGKHQELDAPLSVEPQQGRQERGCRGYQKRTSIPKWSQTNVAQENVASQSGGCLIWEEVRLKRMIK